MGQKGRNGTKAQKERAAAAKGGGGARVGITDAAEHRPDHLMSAEVFSRRRRSIVHTLAAPGDPAARLLCFGSGETREWVKNLRDSLASAPRLVLGSGDAVEVLRSRLVRGFRLYQSTVHGSFLWKAVFECVVGHPVGYSVRARTKARPGGGVALRLSIGLDVRYECPSRYPSFVTGLRGSSELCPDFPPQDGTPVQFVFVPSSRGHAELTDEDILSERHETGVVLHGDSPNYRDAMIGHLRLCGRRPSIIGATPEDCVSQERVVVSYFPFFRQWIDEEHPGESPDTLAELMGFPVRPHRGYDRESCDVWIQPAVQLMEALKTMSVDDAVEAFRNTKAHAITDPSCTFALTQRIINRLSNDDFDEGKQRALFYKHYEAQLERVTMCLFQASEAQATGRGYFSNGDPMG